MRAVGIAGCAASRRRVARRQPPQDGAARFRERQAELEMLLRRFEDELPRHPGQDNYGELACFRLGDQRRRRKQRRDSAGGRCRRLRLPENSGEVLLGQLCLHQLSPLVHFRDPLDADRGSCIFPGGLLEAEVSHKRNGGQP